jgi:hypothetical protein
MNSIHYILLLWATKESTQQINRIIYKKKIMAEYVKLKIVNKAGKNSPIKDSSLYISMYANGTPYIIDTSTGICTAGVAGDTAKPIQFSTLNGYVLKLDASTQMVSGRLYFSSSSTPIESGGPSIISCPDYFDWLEFTLNGPGLTSKQFVINTTQVDQFGFPITLSNMTPKDPEFGSTAGSNPTETRSSIITAFGKLPSAYQDCLLPNRAVSTDPALRILSPGNAIVNKPSSALTSTFDDVLKRFFQQKPYESKSDNSVYIDSVGGYPYVGKLTTVSETGTDGEKYDYPVLQFNYAGAKDAPNPLGKPTPPPSGKGPYNIYFPFFKTKSDSSFPPPPCWWKAGAGQRKGSLPATSSPSQMVFAANGVFADYAFQHTGSFALTKDSLTNLKVEGLPQAIFTKLYSVVGEASKSKADFIKIVKTAVGADLTDTEEQLILKEARFYSALQQEIIGNLENQLNVAFNRGYAGSKSWITLTGKIGPSGSKKNAKGLYESKVNLGKVYTKQNIPNTTVKLTVGMQVLSYASSQPLEISSISKDGTSFTVTSAKEILAQNDQYLAFSNFYEGIQAENSYAKFFHSDSVSIKGRAYAMPFDDQGGFSSTLTSEWTTIPTSLTITLGAWD